MALNKRKLGDFIKESDARNVDNMYNKESVVGLSTQKQIINTKADLSGVSLASYKLFSPGQFAYVPDTSRRGDKMSLAYNSTEKTYLVSSIYIVFDVFNQEELIPEYLFMYYNRPEFDRYSRFNSWGSARETFDWEDMCDIEIELPSLQIQHKYVDLYKAMLANQQAYENGLDDLKLTCDSTIEDFKKKYSIRTFGDHIKRVDERNVDNKYKNVKNVSVTKEFSDVSSKVNKNELSNYKIVKPRQISFVQTTHNEHVFCNALNNTDDVILVTSVNEVFECDENFILPEYLCINFNRSEFDRYARFNSWGSARETFTWKDLIEVKIPIPPIGVQKSLADLFTVYRERKLINQQLKDQIKKICPVLIKGSIEEARKEA
ncbi:MAG: restriction endonuclease subunit S [Erysipelotrichaceae bacterium]|nr:restriction endonuclease subunit S [Erysipelotrichaceae bacterium]